MGRGRGGGSNALPHPPPRLATSSLADPPHHALRARGEGNRRHRFACLILLLLAATIVPAQAQTYPSRPVKIIVPTVAGGVVDVVTRLLAQQLAARLGQGFVVDNRSGAGNTLGSREAARAEPDGTTLLMSSASGQVISPMIYKDAGYDPLKSFAPIGLFAEGSIILVVNPKEPWRSAGEIVAAAKANPGRLNYGSAGTGTLPHLTGELFKASAGVDIVNVPYRGGALHHRLIAGRITWRSKASGPLLRISATARSARSVMVRNAHRRSFPKCRPWSRGLSDG